MTLFDKSGRTTLASCIQITGRLTAFKNCSSRMRLLMALVWGSIFFHRHVTMDVVVNDPIKIDSTASASKLFYHKQKESRVSYRRWSPEQFAPQVMVSPQSSVLPHYQYYQIIWTSWCGFSTIYDTRLLTSLSALRRSPQPRGDWEGGKERNNFASHWRAFPYALGGGGRSHQIKEYCRLDKPKLIR